MPDNDAPIIEDECIGFNLKTQKLYCLIVLDDTIGAAISNQAVAQDLIEQREQGDRHGNVI